MKKLLVCTIFILTLTSSIFSENHFWTLNGVTFKDFAGCRWGSSINVVKNTASEQGLTYDNTNTFDKEGHRVVILKYCDVGVFNVFYYVVDGTLEAGIIEIFCPKDALLTFAAMFVVNYGDPDTASEDNKGFLFEWFLSHTHIILLAWEEGNNTFHAMGSWFNSNNNVEALLIH